MLSRRHHSLGVGQQTAVESRVLSLDKLPPLPLLALPPHPHLQVAIASTGTGTARPAAVHHHYQHQHQHYQVHSSPVVTTNRRISKPTSTTTSTPSSTSTSTLFLLHQPAATTSTRDYVVSCAKDSVFKRETEEKGRRSIMHSVLGLTSSPSPPQKALPLRLHDQLEPTTPFTFCISPNPAMNLTFNHRPSPPRPRKRCRSVADVDGEHSCLHKKKRRLRLFLITSRLSPEFSSPATNIVDRGSSKIAVWARQKALGRNLLRKAAILNRVKRRDQYARETHEGLGVSLAAQEHESKQLELARLALVYGSHDSYTRMVLPQTTPSTSSDAIRIDKVDLSSSPSPNSSSPNFAPVSLDDGGLIETAGDNPNSAYVYAYTPTKAQIPRRNHIPLPPSPLGLSNYDAFDQEDAFPDPYAHFDDDDEEGGGSSGQLFGNTDYRETTPPPKSSIAHSSTTPTSSTTPRNASGTPPPTIYSDFGKLDPGESIVGDFDQVEEGSDPIWPTQFEETHLTNPTRPPEPSPPSPNLQPASCSPNFAAFFASTKQHAPAAPPVQAQYRDAGSQLLDERSRREREVQEERLRQRKLMFPQFHPTM
ncbi:hypothetical protein BU24DRAFT_426372 [Aaosphaeria arxii CBS 175.79]|uniref:Uncharacterized protein n=1 Tax=Aaosphaeria arxii CBS 175.79 TaxID=1450172 RepID=A0A6A5XEM1_9PLEO|nr:uncharacterized protein BU24DRAFT_426372 [Aaosphaeria arxii CBS 175.79]KAF2011291.1 hypothetical protein BU24DRAFT_426372 [Aaosphaeria arxii CBS 175.79]